VKRAATPAEGSDRPTRPVATVLSPPATTAREALIAEAIGDVGRLLDRIGPLVRALEGSRAALANASLGLDGHVKEFEVQVAGFTERAKTGIVKHVERRSAEIVAQSNEAQTQAMRKAARQLFDEEVRPTLRQLTEALRQIVEKTLHPWDRWLTHVATALVSATVTLGAILFLHR
jgi:hypothetical protein